MAQLVITIIAALIALTYGTLALVWPERIQKWWVSNSVRQKVAMKLYGRSLKSGKYILHLRIMGAVALVVSALLFISAFKVVESLR